MKCREIICVAALAAVHTSSALSQTYLDRIDGNEFLVFTDCAMAVWLAEEFSGPFVASTNGDANGDQAEDEADSECAALLHDSNSWQGEFGSGGGEGSAIGASTAWCSLSTGSGSACSMEALLQLGGSAEAEGFGDFGPYAATGLGISSVAGSDNTLGLQPHAWEILDAQSQPKNVIIRGYVTIALQNGADWDPIIRTNAMEIRSTFINVQYQTGNGFVTFARSIEDPQNPGTIIVENGQIAIDDENDSVTINFAGQSSTGEVLTLGWGAIAQVDVNQTDVESFGQHASHEILAQYGLLFHQYIDAEW